jgi:hypothetical protein
MGIVTADASEEQGKAMAEDVRRRDMPESDR